MGGKSQQLSRESTAVVAVDDIIHLSLTRRVPSPVRDLVHCFRGFGGRRLTCGGK